MDRLSNNQSFLIECLTEDIVGYIVVDENLDYDVALDKFYTSKTFEFLSDIKTGLYLEGSAYVYELYKKEQADKSSSAALQAVKELNEQAKANDIADMSLDEINAEISAYRTSRKTKK